jgi:hypothetical protein
MAHFAQLDKNNKVIRVVVIANEEIIDSNGKESEKLGIARCIKLFGLGKWIQTSYNGNLRGTFAGEGYTYNSINNEFVPPDFKK